jgi:hypothetical protein
MASLFVCLQPPNSFWTTLKEGEEAIVQRQEREKEEAETFARTLQSSEGEGRQSNVSIIKCKP